MYRLSLNRGENQGKLMQTCGVYSGIVTCRQSSANDRLRYTIHPDARKELLKRLLLLNHKLYAEEEAKGLHKTKPGKRAEAESDEPMLNI
jgi:hypothetical protein